MNVQELSYHAHIAWAPRSARQRLLTVSVDHVRSFLAGQLQNVVNAGSCVPPA